MWLGVEACHATWEQEENIPEKVVKEFEEQTTLKTNALSMALHGKTLCTLTVDSKQDLEPASKVNKSDRVVIEEDCG